MFYHQNEAELILVMLQGTEQGWEGAGEQPSPGASCCTAPDALVFVHLI